MNNKITIYFIKWFFLIFICFLLQLLFIPVLSINGIIPNLQLALIIITTVLFGIETALSIFTAFAILNSCFVHEKLFLISWIITIFLADKLKPNWRLNLEITVLVQVVLCTLYAELINLFIFAISNNINETLDNYSTLLLSPLLNGLMAILIIFVLRILFKNEINYSYIY